MTINYTPEEISEILNDYFSGITHRQYIGARYVPIFGRQGEESLLWDNTAPYEPLTIVLYQGNSYTSRQYVPIGIDIQNNNYWANTGNYNAQIEQYRRDVLRIGNMLPDSEFSDVNTVKKYIDLNTVKIFDTVDDMVNDDTLLVGKICRTNGFHESGDGGAAWYVITSTGTANEMNIITCGELLANLIVTEDSVTPEMFGAWGDENHNDAPYLQAAINFCGVNDKELVVSNVYRLDETVYVYRALTIRGICAGGVEQLLASKWQAKARFVVNHGGIGIKIIKEGTYGQVFEGGMFCDFGINPSESFTENSNCIGIEISAWSHFTFNRVSFSRFMMGTALHLVNGGQYTDILHCKFENNLIAISEQPNSSDTSKFYVGVLVDGCYFDGNGNGTLFNSDPRENSYGITLYSGANWSIINNRFQGIETCIKTGSGYFVQIQDNRFEMFKYGIRVTGPHCVIAPGNRFDGYLGSSGRTKQAIIIDETATYTVVYNVETSSLEYIPIKDYGTNTRNLFYQHVSMFVKEISESSYLPLGFAKYRGVVSNLVFSTGRISASGGFGNDESNYWNILAGSQKPPTGQTYFKTIGKEWGKTNRYEKLQVIDKINDPDDAGTPIQAGNTFTLYMGKVGSPETLKDVFIDFDFVYWY